MIEICHQEEAHEILVFITVTLLSNKSSSKLVQIHRLYRAFSSWHTHSYKDFTTFLVGTRGLLNFGKKSIWTIKLGKLELDRHFKWIKNI